MITEQQLIDNGFTSLGSHSNRTYYSKKHFYLVEHQGQFYRADVNLESDYENPYTDIQDLMNDYNSWLYDVTTSLQKLLEYLTSDDNDEI